MTIDQLLDKWLGREGGAERANYQMFLTELTQALGLPAPDPKGSGLGLYQFEAPVRSEAALGSKGTGRIDLYKAGCFILEAKQSQLKPGESAPEEPDGPPPEPVRDLFGTIIGHAEPAGRPRPRYDRLMADARIQAEKYALALPGDHRAPPFLIVADIGRSFELYFDWSGNGRGYGPFPDERHYRIGLGDLASGAPIEPLKLDAAQVLRAIWTEPASIDPRLKAAEVTRDIAQRLKRVAEQLEKEERGRNPGDAEIALGIEQTSLFLMRTLFCMFAEDVELLPRDSFKTFLADAKGRSDQFWRSGLADLWSRMNDPHEANRYWSHGDAIIRYFNGNLFSGARVYDLPAEFKGELLVAAGRDWRSVEPAIFGTLLEQVLTAKDRAKLGAHYTPRAYVERLVQATIMDVLQPEWETVRAQAMALLDRSPAGPGDGEVGDVSAPSTAPFPANAGPPAALRPAPPPSFGRSPSAANAGPPAASRPAPPPSFGRSPSPANAGEDKEGALTLVAAFHDRLAGLRILDPACGTGNFLYVAMEQLLRLESEVRQFAQGLGAELAPRVEPNQFLGLELNPRAAVIAELVLWIGWLRYRLANTPGAIGEPVLPPLTNINQGTHGGFDAVLVRTATGEPDLADPRRPDWPEADFIIGNPPFIGGKDIRDRLGNDYAEALWRANPQVPKSADLVMHWWDRAATLLTRPGTRLRRFGFVTTNSITQVFSRRVIERHLTKSSPAFAGEGDEAQPGGGAGGVAAGSAGPGEETRADGPAPPPSFGRSPSPANAGEDPGGLHLVLAIADHPWTRVTRDAAAVRIAMTVAEAGPGEGRLVTITGERKLNTDAPELDEQAERGAINADLSVGTDVTKVVPLKANEGLCSPGVKLHGAGFIVTPAKARELGLGTRPGLEAHIREYRNGRDLLQRPRGVMVIDLFGLTEQEAASRYPEVYQHLLTTVLEEHDDEGKKIPGAGRKYNARESYRRQWWVFGEPRRELRPALADLSRYIGTTETSKHRIFQFVDVSVLPDNKIIAIGDDRWVTLGVLQSRIHTDWASVKGGLLEDRPVYVKGTCFDPFPFPDPSPAVAEIAERLDQTRRTALAEDPKLTMTGLYNLVEAVRSGAALSRAQEAEAVRARARIVAKLHDDLDSAVADAYGWGEEWRRAPLPPGEIVARLVKLNAERAAEEASGHVRWLRPDYQAPRFGGGGRKIGGGVAALSPPSSCRT